MSNLLKSAVRYAFSFALLVISLSFQGVVRAESPSPSPILVELFTSEGCSDCPPADTFLRALDASQPVPGAQLIVLEEHVDYWDDLGWRDPFSSRDFTERQSAYVGRLRVSNGPYTPQMVVDGTDGFVGSDRRTAARAFAKAAAAPKVNVEISALHVENGKIFAKIAAPAVSSRAQIFVALALDHAQSDVSRGENGGRRLDHVAIAKRLTEVGSVKSGEPFAKEVELTADKTGQSYRLIAFVQESGLGKVLGAAEAHLP